jgi:hypothetical protein
VHLRRSGLIPVTLACAAVIAVAFVAESYDVLDEGKLVEDVEERVYKVRVRGGLELYVSDRLTLDGRSGAILAAELMTGFAFALLCGVGMLGAAVTRGREGRGGRSPRTLALAVSIGAALLAVDELLEASEALEYSVYGGDGPLPIELDVVVYGAAALAFIVWFRGLLRVSLRGASWIGVGAMGIAIAALFDLADLAPRSQEVVEACAAVALLAGFAFLFADLSQAGRRTAAS